MLFLEIILIMISQLTLGWIVKNAVLLAGELHGGVQKALTFSNLQFPYFTL